jgi:hypothetical protein
MPMCRRLDFRSPSRYCFPCIVCGPGRGAGETPVVLDPAAVLALAEEPWRDRRSFVDALDAVLGGLELDMPRLPEAVREDDPFLWSVMGRFGAAGAGRSSGGIVACSRYGLITRDRLAERPVGSVGLRHFRRHAGRARRCGGLARDRVSRGWPAS